MSICQDCIFWCYTEGNVAGICGTTSREHLGRVSPVSLELVGDSLFHQCEEGLATYPGTTCPFWESSEEWDEDLPYIDEQGEAHEW